MTFAFVGVTIVVHERATEKPVQADEGAADGIPTPAPTHGQWNWVAGDGVGGIEELIGKAPDRSACEKICLEKAKLDPGINGCTYGTGGCYAEKGMTGAAESSNYVTSYLPKGALGPWNWVLGDGYGADCTEEDIGQAPDRSTCENMCLEAAKSDPRINGCTYSNTGGTRCIA